jgi:hypothetical protein
MVLLFFLLFVTIFFGCRSVGIYFFHFYSPFKIIMLMKKKLFFHRQRDMLLPTCLTLLLNLNVSAAQCIQYSYDAAGNRTLRKAVTQEFTQARTKTHGETMQDETAAQSGTLEASKPTPRITVYPNPTHGLLVVNIVSSNPSAEVQVHLYSISGVLVQQWVITSGNSTLDISALMTGIYIMRVAQRDEQSESWRIIKM